MRVSFVIPVYNERDTLEALTQGILEHVAPHEAEVLFVDDGSMDGSREVLAGLRERHPGVVEVLRFRRNFGKSAALAAGFQRVTGDVVFTMDADLQDDPTEIPRFIQKLEEGFDIVVGWKQKRHDPWHKTFPSHLYNRFVACAFKLPLHDINCGFKLYRGPVVKRLNVYGEFHRLLPALAAALGYRSVEIPVTHHPRRYGVSKYGFERFAKGAIDVLTVWFLTRHAYTPGHFFGKWGGLFFGKAALSVFLAVVLGLLFQSALLAAVLFLLAVALAATGSVFLALGLFSELVLRHFVRIDPSLFLEDQP